MNQKPPTPMWFTLGNIRALRNTAPGWPPTPIDPGQPYKWQTRRVLDTARPFMRRSGYDWPDREPEPMIVLRPDGESWCVSRRVGDVIEYYRIPHQPDSTVAIPEPVRVVEVCTQLGVCIQYDSDGVTRWVKWPFRLKYAPVVNPKRLLPRCRFRELWRETRLIRGVRVERLQDISIADCIAEGAAFPPEGQVFQELWNSINAKRGKGWATNPWVLAYELEVTQ